MAGANRPPDVRGEKRLGQAGGRDRRVSAGRAGLSGNIWFLERDGGVFARMIDRLHSRYGIDRERVYLTGFSNGGMMTREAGTRYPQLSRLYHLECTACRDLGFAEGGWQMPCFIYLGDNDPVARGTEEPLLEQMLRANCCAAVRTAGGFVPDAIYNGENHYTAARGYTEGERFGTAVYRDAQGVPRVCVTVMKNMPHGAIHDESRAAWEFMRRYRRPGNGKAVETVPHTESTETECAKTKEERLK